LALTLCPRCWTGIVKALCKERLWKLCSLLCCQCLPCVSSFGGCCALQKVTCLSSSACIAVCNASTLPCCVDSVTSCVLIKVDGVERKLCLLMPSRQLAQESTQISTLLRIKEGAGRRQLLILWPDWKRTCCAHHMA